VPLGFRTRADTPIKTIAVGHDGSAEAEEALSAAVTTAHALGAELRIVCVYSPVDYPVSILGAPGYVTPPQDLGRFAQETLDAAVAAVRERVETESVFITGDAVGDLVDQSTRADLLFLGSRGYGPHRAVLLGSVSGRVLREAECPVIVVPRKVQAPLESLFPVPEDSLAGT
jgi:nucleotide-binding universal stress UspA family protein